MPFINLIQEQRLQARTDERKARTFFMVFALTGAASVTAFGFLAFLTEVTSSERSRLQAAVQKNAPVVREIEENQKQISELNPRLQTLEDAQVLTERWGRILGHIATQTPKGTWLTGIRSVSTNPDQPIELSLVGISDTQERIAEFILRIQNSADLENVQLRFTQEKLVQQGRGIEFDMKAGIVGTAVEKAKDEAKEEGKK